MNPEPPTPVETPEERRRRLNREYNRRYRERNKERLRNADRDRQRAQVEQCCAGREGAEGRKKWKRAPSAQADLQHHQGAGFKGGKKSEEVQAPNLTGVSVYHLDRSPKLGTVSSPWALKKVNKKFANGDYGDRLKKEADILKSLDHPNIIGFRGFSKMDDGREVLAMEKCTQSLGDLIQNYFEMQLGPFTPELIYIVAYGVAKALHYLHTKCHLLHGDIKSYNVLIKGDFEMVKLCDFGVSLEFDSNGEVPVEDFVGTASWCAPEAIGDGPITAKSDIFSLGLTLWEMLSLVPPHFDGNEYLELDVTEKLLNDSLNTSESRVGTRPALPNIPLGPEYANIIELFDWCTEEDQTKRPTAKEIIEKLKSIGVVDDE